jgi:glycerol-3-phosphate dehydrogenase (NAD(P)+)
MKNVYAISMGLIDGWLEARGIDIVQTRQTILNECLVEFIRLGLSYGSELHTLIGPAGVGDIVASSSSPASSRNYRWGRWYAGTQLTSVTTRSQDIHEGYETCAAMVEMAAALRIEAPVLEATHEMLFEGTRVDATVTALIRRLSGIVMCGGMDVLLRRTLTSSEGLTHADHQS